MHLTLKKKRITVADGTSLNTVITSKHCANKKDVFLWILILCSSVGGYQGFGGTYCLQICSIRCRHCVPFKFYPLMRAYDFVIQKNRHHSANLKSHEREVSCHSIVHILM
jgi:hypothetical protein